MDPVARLRGRIMIVDDEPSMVMVIERQLRRAGYGAFSGTSKPLEAEAGYTSFGPDILILDLNMPVLDGFDLLARLLPRLTADLVPVLVLTGDPSPATVTHALSSGAKDFVAKPFESTELVLRVENLLESRFAQLALRDHNDQLEIKVLDRTRDLANAELATLQVLARAAEFRDDATGRHTQRVGEMAALLAGTVGLADHDVELIRVAAPLHDIGKIGIPDRILLKPGPLTAEERDIMQMHAAMGAKILGVTRFPILTAAREIALAHHEHWDGAGYPRGLVGADIPQFARIVAIADVFDALRHDRPYRRALELDVVVGMIIAASGSHLDPEVVAAMTTLARNGTLARLSENWSTHGLPLA